MGRGCCENGSPDIPACFDEGFMTNKQDYHLASYLTQRYTSSSVTFVFWKNQLWNVLTDVPCIYIIVP